MTSIRKNLYRSVLRIGFLDAPIRVIIVSVMSITVSHLLGIPVLIILMLI